MTHDEVVAEMNRLCGDGWTEAGQKAKDAKFWSKQVNRPVAAQQAPQASDWQARNRARAVAWEAERAAKLAAKR